MTDRSSLNTYRNSNTPNRLGAANSTDAGDWASCKAGQLIYVIHKPSLLSLAVDGDGDQVYDARRLDRNVFDHRPDNSVADVGTEEAITIAKDHFVRYLKENKMGDERSISIYSWLACDIGVHWRVSFELKMGGPEPNYTPAVYLVAKDGGTITYFNFFDKRK